MIATGSPLKKTLRAAEQDRPDVAAARAELKAEQPRLDAHRLVFLEETAVTTKMVRHYGRSPRGERLVAKVPHGHWKTMTFVGALRSDAMTAPYVIDGAMDGEAFLADVKSPALWGTEEHLVALFRETADVATKRQHFTFRYRSPMHMVDLFRSVYGPVHKAFSALDATKSKALERDILALVDEFNVARDGTMVVPSAYLEVVATRI